jgi:RNA polymerase sigma-70 factor (ECF subfamily)
MWVIKPVMEGRSPADLAMDRYAAGEDGAFAEVYDAIGPRVYGFLLRKTRDAGIAEDVLQQTMLRIHEHRGTFEVGAHVVPWAIAIASRLAVDAHRRRRKEALSATDHEPDATSPDPDAEAYAVAAETAKKIRAELDKIPENQRVAFELIKQEGLPVAQAAAVLGISVSAVKLRAFRAYEALRKVLGDAIGGEP